jgi:hypothetical protein
MKVIKDKNVRMTSCLRVNGDLEGPSCSGEALNCSGELLVRVQ